MKILLFFLFPLFLFSNDKIMLIVDSKDISKDYIDIIKESSASVITKENHFIIDEEAQKKSLKEQYNQRISNIYNESSLVETGKLVAANKIFFINVDRFNNKYRVNVKFVDVEGGIVLKSDSDYIESINNIENFDKFIKKITKKQFLNNESIVTINSTPVNADIFVNKEKKGLTPLELVIENNKKINLKIELKGYKTIEEKLIVNGDVEKSFELIKIKENANLTIKTSNYAHVYIDGQSKGVSPTSIHNIECKKYSLKIVPEDEKYKTINKKIEITDDTDLFFELELKESEKEKLEGIVKDNYFSLPFYGLGLGNFKYSNVYFNSIDYTGKIYEFNFLFPGVSYSFSKINKENLYKTQGIAIEWFLGLFDDVKKSIDSDFLSTEIYYFYKIGYREGNHNYFSKESGYLKGLFVTSGIKTIYYTDNKKRDYINGIISSAGGEILYSNFSLKMSINLFLSIENYFYGFSIGGAFPTYLPFGF